MSTIRAGILEQRSDSATRMAHRGSSDRGPLLLHGLRILTVDDDPDVRNLVGFILRRQGAEVKTADSARSCLMALAFFSPHLLISDLSMPGEDGFSLIRRIRTAQGTGSAVPAIALSALADRENEKKALEAGFDSFVGKPVQPKRLVDLISWLFQQSTH